MVRIILRSIITGVLTGFNRLGLCSSKCRVKYRRWLLTNFRSTQLGYSWFWETVTTPTSTRGIQTVSASSDSRISGSVLVWQSCECRVYSSIPSMNSLFLIVLLYHGSLSVKWKWMSKSCALRHHIWWHLIWLCAIAVTQSSDFTVRARHAARIISKDISRVYYGVSRFWNHLVSKQ